MLDLQQKATFKHYLVIDSPSDEERGALSNLEKDLMEEEGKKNRQEKSKRLHCWHALP